MRSTHPCSIVPFAALLLALSSGCEGADPSDCFSPETPEGSTDPARTGCACEGDASVCVRSDGAWIALECAGGRWTSGDPSSCMPSSASSPACEVEGVVYAPGSEGISDPFSCNTCSCASGSLSCTRIGCPRECPEGTAAGQTCVSCGPAGGCLVVRTDCLPRCETSEECGVDLPLCDPETGTCTGGCR